MDCAIKTVVPCIHPPEIKFWLSTLVFYFVWLQVLSMREHYGKLDKAVMSIWECCELLNHFVDESDPDLDEPQIEHLLQTTKAIHIDYPNEYWLHLIDWSNPRYELH